MPVRKSSTDLTLFCKRKWVFSTPQSNEAQFVFHTGNLFTNNVREVSFHLSPMNVSDARVVAVWVRDGESKFAKEHLQVHADPEHGIFTTIIPAGMVNRGQTYQKFVSFSGRPNNGSTYMNFDTWVQDSGSWHKPVECDGARTRVLWLVVLPLAAICLLCSMLCILMTFCRMWKKHTKQYRHVHEFGRLGESDSESEFEIRSAKQRQMQDAKRRGGAEIDKIFQKQQHKKKQQLPDMSDVEI